MTERSYRRLNLLLLAALFAGSLAVYDQLPDRYPVQFGFGGTPTRWESRSLQSWLFLPLLATAVTALMAAVTHWCARRPELWSVPDRERFLALPPAARTPIVNRLRTFVAQVNVLTTALMMAAQAATFRAATSAPGELSGWLLALIPVFVAVLLVLALRMNAAIGTDIREAHRRLGTA